MKRPDDIPEDVWEDALDSALDWFGADNRYYYECARHFAMTVMAERERCANVADYYALRAGDEGAAVIAAEIRNGAAA